MGGIVPNLEGFSIWALVTMTFFYFVAFKNVFHPVQVDEEMIG